MGRRDSTPWLNRASCYPDSPRPHRTIQSWLGTMRFPRRTERPATRAMIDRTEAARNEDGVAIALRQTEGVFDKKRAVLTKTASFCKQNILLSTSISLSNGASCSHEPLSTPPRPNDPRTDWRIERFPTIELTSSHEPYLDRTATAMQPRTSPTDCAPHFAPCGRFVAVSASGACAARRLEERRRRPSVLIHRSAHVRSHSEPSLASLVRTPSERSSDEVRFTPFSEPPKRSHSVALRACARFTRADTGRRSCSPDGLCGLRLPSRSLAPLAKTSRDVVAEPRWLMAPFGRRSFRDSRSLVHGSLPLAVRSFRGLPAVVLATLASNRALGPRDGTRRSRNAWHSKFGWL
jgi:hypothetical protein